MQRVNSQFVYYVLLVVEKLFFFFFFLLNLELHKDTNIPNIGSRCKYENIRKHSFNNENKDIWPKLDIFSCCSCLFDNV
jgi:hypothetical protein